jgi:phospholipid/cholesterol/gamma-HCH transport system ATP-binding protein
MSAGAETAESHVRLDRVSMSFGDRPVFRSLTVGFPRGKISVILGGSGSGKSTLLRLVGGLVCPQSGAVTVGDVDVTRLSERRLYDVRRKLGMMFQGGALLDSLTVFDNIAFPLREHTEMSEAEIATEVHDRLAAVGLSEVDDLLPGELSGGMLKRVALARAIIRKPEVLLCDEPFSGLDPASTKRIERLLVRTNRQYGSTMLVVSHHIPSTLRMADQILLLLPDGAVVGAPGELTASGDRRVTSFLDESPDEEDNELFEPDAPPAGAAARASGGRRW